MAVTKRIFYKGDKSVRTTISMTPSMEKALLELKELSGDSVPKIVCEAIEDYLVAAAIRGIIKVPKGEESALQEIISEHQKS